jgi:hypothetical protein
MQHTEGQNEGPIPDFEPTPRQPATGSPQYDGWSSPSWSLESDGSKAVDSQVILYAENGERLYEHTVL